MRNLFKNYKRKELTYFLKPSTEDETHFERKIITPFKKELTQEEKDDLIFKFDEDLEKFNTNPHMKELQQFNVSKINESKIKENEIDFQHFCRVKQVNQTINRNKIMQGLSDDLIITKIELNDDKKKV